MSELKRNRNESFEGFMRRVKQQWQRQGTILQARKIQYFTPTKSKNVNRTQAVKRVSLKTKTERLRKAGKLPAEDFKNKKRR